jgi:aerobic carbon-monoxide dehydrogenase small subunit
MTKAAITLNGLRVEDEVPPRTSLADFIREHAGLTGTHLGCEHGICGACTVEIDGEIARSCIAFAVACDGASVRTVEGFDGDPLMERLRKAFTEEHALQCGYCTPGMLIAARDLIRRRAARTRSEIQIAMSGNLCRCTGYAGIVAAVKRVLDEEGAMGASKEYASQEEVSPLGPVGSHALSVSPAGTSAPQVLEKQTRTAPAFAAGSSRTVIKVTTNSEPVRDGITTLTQSFVLPHPREAVWAQFSDLELLVKCLPGASLDSSVGPDGHFSGTMKVVFGPISPVFKGSGSFRKADAGYSGHIEGAGQDGRAGAKAKGEMSFHLTALEDAKTLVEASISYRLAGALAQFGRPSIIRGIVTGIGSVFATNIDRSIAGQSGAGVGERGLGGGFLLGAIVRAWSSVVWHRVSILRYLSAQRFSSRQ